jgi:hypothetical protein
VTRRAEEKKSACEFSFCLSTYIDELAARGLGAGADLDVAVREPRLDEVHVAHLVPDRGVVPDARRLSIAGLTQQRGRGQEPRAERQQPPPAGRCGLSVARRRSRRGRGVAGRDGERSAGGLRERRRRRDWAGRRERRQGGDGGRHGCVAWIIRSPNCAR